MVADTVQVYTRSWQKKGKGYCWESDGGGTYQIDEIDGQRRGTKIVIKLKDDFSDYAKEERIKDIVKKYSAFVQFPVSVNGEKVNTVDAIWLRSKMMSRMRSTKNFTNFRPMTTKLPSCECISVPMLRLKSTHFFSFPKEIWKRWVCFETKIKLPCIVVKY